MKQEEKIEGRYVGEPHKTEHLTVSEQAEIADDKSHSQKEKTEGLRTTTIAPSITPLTVPSIQDPLKLGVETVLEEGLDVMYRELSPEEQEKIKDQGEKAASAITIILRSTKVKIKKIVKIIAAWLRLIPKVNRHYLEQEAKIKTDKILHLAEENKKNQL